MNRLRADAITWRIQWNNCENLSQGSTWRWQIRISETFGSHFSLIYFPLSGLIATSGHYLHRFLIRLLNSQLSISESSHYFDWIKILRVFYLFIYSSFCCRHGQHPWGQNGGRCQRRPTGGVKLPFKPERINIIRKSHQTFQIVVSSLFCCFFVLFFFVAVIFFSCRSIRQ